MSFGAPGYLLFVALAPLALVAVALWLRWRGRARSHYGAGPGAGAGNVARQILVVAAIALAALAAARPQIGERATEVEDRGIDLAIVLDVSNSMLADDAEPTRLGRAQAEIAALLERLRGDRAGLVIFAGRPFTRSPLTSDVDALRRLVDDIDDDRGLVPPGSDLGAAIRSGQKLLEHGQADTKALLIISDGEDHGESIDAAIAEARVASIRVYTAGAGTAAGVPVRIVDPETGEVSGRTDASGAPAITRLDAGALRALAAAGGGRYVELTGEGRPLAGLASEFDALADTLFATERQSQPVERHQWFAAGALALLAAELLFASGLLRRETARAARRLWPLGATALFAGAICTTSASDLNRRGNEHYAAEEYADAIARYEEAQARAPDEPELPYNAGNAYNLRGEFDTAVQESSRALAEGSGIEAQAEYAIGNHHAGAGRLSDAREAYKRALLADPGDADAKHNLEVVDARLRATPTPEPTPSSVPAEDPGDSDPSDGDPGDGDPGDGTPAAGEGTPAAGDPGDISPEELERLLAEALEGIDSEFTVEEALRALDLLAEQNRKTAQEGEATGVGSAGPDW